MAITVVSIPPSRLILGESLLNPLIKLTCTPTFGRLRFLSTDLWSGDVVVIKY